MTLGPVTLAEFLEQTNLEIANVPPWLHSTSSHNIWSILGSNKLLSTPCTLFKKDNLCYFFVGRPAYKTKDVDAPSVLQMPMVFVMRFQRPPIIKRVFPFDSGAFHYNKLPSYITCFDLESFDISSDLNNIGRLISLLYKSPRRYFDRRAAGYQELIDEHSFSFKHHDILATSRLSLDNSNMECDDRSAAIEISVTEDVPLRSEHLIGLIVPEDLARDLDLYGALKSLTKFVETYRPYPLKLSFHYGQIYEAVERIYKRAGIPL